MGPGHPGHVHLGPGQPLQEGPVGGDGGPAAQRGHVPRPADHGHAFGELPSRRPDLEPHVGLPHEVPYVTVTPSRSSPPSASPSSSVSRSAVMASSSAVNGASASPAPRPRCSITSSHQRSGSSCPAAAARAASGSRRTSAGAVPGRTGRSLVGPAAVRIDVPVAVRRPPRQRVRGREVDEAGRDVVLEGPADGHPLRGELGQRPERRAARFVHGVGEERDRRPHVLVGGQWDQGVGLRRSLDQHDSRPGRLQRRPHRPGRPRPVVAYPEQQQ